MSGQKTSSLAKVLPVVKILLRSTARKEASALSKALITRLNARFGDLEEKSSLKLARLLGPRFRKSGSTSQEAADRVVEELKEVTRQISVGRSQPQHGSLEVAHAPPSKKPSLLWSDFDEE